MTRIRLGVTMALLACRAYAQAETTAPAPPVAFKIESQPVDSALKAFASQSGLQLLFHVEGAAIEQGTRSPGVEGTLTPEAALRELLANTGLRYEFINPRTVTIRSKEAREKPTAAVEQPLEWRLAQAEGATSSQAGSGASVDSATDRDGAQLEEIVVTAQKRQESVIKVPISMSVLGADDLEAMRVKEIQDFIFTIPNAMYTRSLLEVTQVTLRGIGGNSGGKFSPTLVTVDDAAFGFTSTGNLLSSRLLDAERVEVLRGPQGTLTGASAMGGVINIITRKPTSEGLQLDGTLDVGRFGTALVKAAANVPITERLAARATAYFETSDGAVKNAGPSGGDSGYDNRGARVAVRFKPTDQLTLDASYSREGQRYGLRSALYLDRFTSEDAVTREEAIAELAAAGANYFDGDFLPKVGNNGGHWFTDVDEHTDLDNEIFSTKATLDVGQHAISLTYGRYESDSFNIRDRDKSELAINYISQGYDYATDSVELKAVSSYAGSLNWVAGLSYAREDQRIFTYQFNGDGTIGGAYAPLRYSRFLTTLESRGIFANAFWDITDRLHLTAGLRWSKSESQSASGRSPTNPLPDYSDALEASLTQLNPRVALNFDLNDHVTTYVQYATGFRVGYGNDPAGAGLHDTSTLGVIDVPLEVDNERVKNYEVGLKGYFLDKRASLAVAAFHIDYTDLQVYGGYTLDDFVNFDVNAGEAWTRGFEVEAEVRPVRNLDFRASIGHVETRLKSLLGQDTVGKPSIADVRPWTGTLVGRYQHPISERLNGSVQAVFNWQAKAETGFASAYDVQGLPSFNTLDLTVGVGGNRWAVSAYFNNILNEIYWLNDPGGLSRRGAEAYFLPRTYGLRATMSFK